MDKQALKSAIRRTEKQNNIGSIPVPPQTTKPLESPNFNWLGIPINVASQEDWDSLKAQADRIPDREDLVWIRDDNGDVVAAMINDPELIEIYKNAYNDESKKDKPNDGK